MTNPESTVDTDMQATTDTYIDKIIVKLSKLQSLNLTVSKDGQNPHFKNKYATLDEIIKTYSGPLSELWLVISHHLDISDSCVVTKIFDSESCQHILTSFPVSVSGTAQQIWSYLTYAKRYNLWLLLNIATEEDDDGSGAKDIQIKSIQAEAPKPIYTDTELSKLSPRLWKKHDLKEAIDIDMVLEWIFNKFKVSADMHSKIWAIIADFISDTEKLQDEKNTIWSADTTVTDIGDDDSVWA